MGTFVFTFVAQHAIHLVFQSLRPESRNMENFEKTTTLATILATTISFGMGIFVYMTFWEETSSAMFYLYPPSGAVDMCRILLCTSMLLTYPFPFLTVRELIVLLVFSKPTRSDDSNQSSTMEEPLFRKQFADARESWLLPGEERQLKRNYHITLTVMIWSLTMFLALEASSLGDVLNLTGCATGTGAYY